MSRMAVLSDIHGNLPALEVVLEHLRARNVEVVFNLGDALSGPLWPRETARLLMRQNWIQVLGNHDRQLFAQPPEEHGLSDRQAFTLLESADLDWLRSLPSDARAADGIQAFHGTPSSDSTYLLETVEQGRARLASREEIQARLNETCPGLLLCGHSHIPRVVSLPGDLTIVNPGSVGLPAYDDELPEHHVMETGSPHARYAVLDRGSDGWVVELIALAYDHDAAADQARRNNRPDWEIGLRSGFMR
jgi:predicted phosphodiesterase